MTTEAVMAEAPFVLKPGKLGLAELRALGKGNRKVDVTFTDETGTSSNTSATAGKC